MGEAEQWWYEIWDVPQEEWTDYDWEMFEEYGLPDLPTEDKRIPVC